MHSNPNVSSCPAFLPDTAQRSWSALDRSAETAVATFDPNSIGMLPAAVVRWLRHTTAPDTLYGRAGLDARRNPDQEMDAVHRPANRFADWIHMGRRSREVSDELPGI
jgi:hypothetical protein